MAGAEAGGLIGGLTADAWGLVCGQLAELEDLVAVSAVCQGLLQVARGHRTQGLGVVLVHGDVTRRGAKAWPHLPLVSMLNAPGKAIAFSLRACYPHFAFINCPFFVIERSFFRRVEQKGAQLRSSLQGLEAKRSELVGYAEMLREEGMPAYETFLNNDDVGIDIQDWIQSVQSADTAVRFCELEIEMAQTKAGHFDTLCRLLSHH